MMKKALLLSEAQLKEQSNIERNVDGKLLAQLISDVQEIELRETLGAQLYDQVMEEFKAAADPDNPVPLSEARKALIVEYIRPFLIHAVMVKFIVLNNYKLTNKGVLKLNDTLATNVSPQEAQYAKNHFEGLMLGYKKLLVDYLHKNQLAVDGTDTSAGTGSTGWFVDCGNRNYFI